MRRLQRNTDRETSYQLDRLETKYPIYLYLKRRLHPSLNGKKTIQNIEILQEQSGVQLPYLSHSDIDYLHEVAMSAALDYFKLQDRKNSDRFKLSGSIALNTTKAEKAACSMVQPLLNQYLRYHEVFPKYDCDLLVQRKITIGPYSPDIIILGCRFPAGQHVKGVILEIDGIHHELDKIKKDRVRDAVLNALGFHVYHITNEQVWNKEYLKRVIFELTHTRKNGIWTKNRPQTQVTILKTLLDIKLLNIATFLNPDNIDILLKKKSSTNYNIDLGFYIFKKSEHFRKGLNVSFKKKYLDEKDSEIGRYIFDLDEYFPFLSEI